MSKTKTPFFSLGSKGTVGGVLTSQKHGGVTLLRKTPVPTDPYSLAQAYQRWDYRDYAYQWTLLTNSEKQTYQTRATRYHITGYSLFMRENLNTLPDLTGRWHLDSIANSLTPDSSKNANPGTVYGASLVKGIIDKALTFDGIDDYVDCGSVDVIGDQLTLEAWVNWTSTPHVLGYIISKAHSDNTVNYALYINGTSKRLTFRTTLYDLYSSIGAIQPETWYHILCTYSNIINKQRIYINGNLDAEADVSGILLAKNRPLRLGAWYGADPYYRLKATIDQVIVYSRALDITEIKRHAERRYP